MRKRSQKIKDWENCHYRLTVYLPKHTIEVLEKIADKQNEAIETIVEKIITNICGKENEEIIL